MAWRDSARHILGDLVVRRRLPSGPEIFVSPSSQLKYIRPGPKAFDPALLDWADRFVSPGDVVWDIGANVGCFTFAAAAKGAKVIAVEPDPFLAELLIRSRRANPTLDVTVIAAAISNQPGLVCLKAGSQGRATNQVSEAGDYTVPALTLDGLLGDYGPANVIKIDVEGHEPKVLMGATEVLKTHPRIIVEAWKEHREEITNLLAGAVLRDLTKPDAPVVDRATFNTLAQWN